LLPPFGFLVASPAFSETVFYPRHGDLESNRLPSLLIPNLTVVRWMRAAKASFSPPMRGERLVEEPGCRHIALGGISSGPKGSDTQTVSTGAAY
jgi:hypothetical protein